jgi:hypothetical protein
MKQMWQLNFLRVHLHELPMIHSICGRGRLYAPNLESIKVRCCWSLTRLPAVGGGKYKGKVECDCEKEWWDKMDNNHDSSLYNGTTKGPCLGSPFSYEVRTYNKHEPHISPNVVVFM